MVQNVMKSTIYENRKCYLKPANPKNIGKEIAFIDNIEMILIGLYNNITKKSYGNTTPSDYKWISNSYGWVFYYKTVGGK